MSDTCKYYEDTDDKSLEWGFPVKSEKRKLVEIWKKCLWYL